MKKNYEIARVLTTILVIVGVSNAGTALKESGKLVATAVMVRLTLGTTSLLAADVFVVAALSTGFVVVVGGRAAVVVAEGFDAAVVVAAACARVNMVDSGCLDSRRENFLLVTCSDSLTNMGGGGVT